jgi:hypothetical protein
MTTVAGRESWWRRASRRRRRALAIALLLAALAPVGIAAAQRFRFVEEPNVPYDGRFTFARLRYQIVYRRSGWEFDYPEMERHLMLMVKEITTLRPHVTGSNIHDMDDPELLKYPLAYLSEPGYWVPSASEAKGLRAYLEKGGFLIVDDFMRNEWYNFERSMKMVLPNARIDRLDVSHPIFDSFFHVKSLDMHYPHDPGLKAEFLGIHEDNDPKKRLMVVINYNNDIGDYMEHSGQAGWWPVNITNDAYKLATNYIVYAMTH